jgi:hypothetical protein
MQAFQQRIKFRCFFMGGGWSQTVYLGSIDFIASICTATAITVTKNPIGLRWDFL